MTRRGHRAPICSAASRMASSAGAAACRRGDVGPQCRLRQRRRPAMRSPRTAGGRSTRCCPAQQLATVHQVHSPTVVYVDRAWPQDERPHADAMVTDRPGILLGVLTADCAPVLFADPEAGVVGAAHSGWRGAFGGVNEATIEAMEQLRRPSRPDRGRVGPSRRAGILRSRSTAFRDRFLDQDQAQRALLRRRPARQAAFRPAGLHSSPARQRRHRHAASASARHLFRPRPFYSYRRSTHRNEPSYGRQISMIGLSA